MTMDNDCVRVAVRIRPLVKSEVDRGCQMVVEKIPSEPQIIIHNSNACNYTFNYVFESKDTQKMLYESAVYPLLEKLYKGYNVTLLAYGQTGSGKTHTMGTAFNGDFGDEMGVIPRAMKDIFEHITNSSDLYDYNVSCSFMELYQEQLFDLLSTCPRDQTIVDIREDKTGILIPGLTETKVSSALETTDCLIKGSSGRAVGATAMNQQSSRSHAIFTVTIQMTKKDESKLTLTSKFNLVDLAGSERSKKTKATGNRFKEGVKINHGLFVLGNVISVLGNSQGNVFVNYRDSKLTRLLQDSLGGNSITLMIACISPADYNLEETKGTLQYADRARKIKNKPIINQDPNVAEINRLNGIIQKLRLDLLNKGGSSEDSCKTGGMVSIQEYELMKKTKMNLIERNFSLQQQLQAIYNELNESQMFLCDTDNANELLQNKLIKVNDLVIELDTKFNENNCPPEVIEYAKQVTKIREFMKDIFGTLEKTKEDMLNMKKSITASTNITAEVDGDAENEAIHKKLEIYTAKQTETNNEIRRINRELLLKEELHQKVAGNLLKFCDYENNEGEQKIKEFEEQIRLLEIEKEDLLQKLKHVKNNVSAKLAEERRKRLNQLEHDIADLKRKNLQQSKILKVREKEAQKIENLNSEIQAMKAAKIKLIRSMKAESDNFRQWKLTREKEITQLKAKSRKRENEITRMESLHNKQRNVLKRKVEEAMAINKRLKDALEKQKVAQMQRSKNTLIGGKVDQTVLMIEHELDVIMSVIDAEHSLEQLMEDRAVINSRLNELKKTDPSNIAELQSLEEELEMRNAQINDIQQKLVSTNIENKMKGLCDGIQSIPEARVVLKHIFNAIADMRRSYVTKDSQIEEFKTAFEAEMEKIETLSKQLKNVQNQYQEKMALVEKSYEEKIAILLRELNSKPQVTSENITPEMDERIRIQQDAFDKLDSLRDELENYKVKCMELEKIVKLKKTLRPKELKLVSNNIDDIYVSENEGLYDDLIDDPTADPDWRLTPKWKRVRKSNNTSTESKHSSSKINGTLTESSTYIGAVKRSSDGSVRCFCKNKCSTKRCKCRSIDQECSENCKCSDSCQNHRNSDDSNDNENQNSLINVEKNDSLEHFATPKKTKLSILEATTPAYPVSVKSKKFFD